MRYSDAGVDISRADAAKQKIRHLAGRTFNKSVLAPIGGFGALFHLDPKRWRDPVLVSSADGVGTKLKVATAAGVHSTVGADIVNHCVNDILTQCAEPLFFLDYLAMARIEPNIVEQILDGMSRAARQAGCALIGGETAEMPGMYAPGEYDLAGFIVGAVERGQQADPRRVRAGDILFGLPSSGLHTNGYSLARKLVFEVAQLKPDAYVAEISNKIAAELLKPHRCYWPMLKNIVRREWLSGMAHITGGGIPGNLPRALPRNVQAVVELGSWPVLPIFEHLRDLGQVPQDEMLRTFNMGIGLIAAIPAAKFTRAKNLLDRAEEKFYVIGRVVKGERRVQYT